VLRSLQSTKLRQFVVCCERLEWRSVICEINTSANVVQDVQRALASAGYNPGPIDGVMGRQTMTAVERFQRSKGLPTGGLTMETLKRLGVEQ